MTPRILLLSTSLGMGGADRQILYLARALMANQSAVRLISMTPLEEMGQRALAGGLDILSLNMERGRADVSALRRLVALLRDWRPHLLTSFMYHANIMGRLAGRAAGVPVIVTSVRNERLGSSSREWLMRATNWMDHCCTTNSEQVAESLRTRKVLPAGKLRIIPNGVEIPGPLPPAERLRVRGELKLEPTEFLWLAVGRLLPQKDYPNLLQAFQPLAAAPSRLAIVGRGPLLPQLQQHARELGIESRVRFLGVRQDVGALLSAADGFVLSSAWEGMPNVVMEALAAGVPVVATQVGGVSELVQAGDSGFLVPPRNPEALSHGMRELMSLSPEQRRHMGLLGRDHIAAGYGLPAMASRWVTLYQRLLTGKGLTFARSGLDPGIG